RDSEPAGSAFRLRVPHPLPARRAGVRRRRAGAARPGRRTLRRLCAPGRDPVMNQPSSLGTPGMPTPRDIVYQIRSRRDGLSATERKVADAILDDIAHAAGATVDQLAHKAGVSIATISRFARSVGCDDTRDLKLRLAQASAVGERFLDRATPAPEESTFYARLCTDIERTLRAHLPLFSEPLFEQAAAMVGGARMTYVFGMGGASAVLAQEMQSRLVRLGYPVAAYSDAVLLRMVAATLDERDVVVVLSTSGLTPEILAAARIVKQYGAQLLALTDPTSPLAELADVSVPIRTAETDFIYKPSSSRYAMLLAIDILATELALARQEATQERLRRIKLALDAYRGGPNRLPLGD